MALSQLAGSRWKMKGDVYPRGQTYECARARNGYRDDASVLARARLLRARAYDFRDDPGIKI